MDTQLRALLHTPTLVFCDPRAEARLRGSWAADAAVTFVPLALEDFYVSRSTRIDWQQQHRLDPESGLHSERLYKVWLERPALMLRAVELFPNYTHFFWLDIGIFRDVVPQPGEVYLHEAVAACAGAGVTMLEIAPFADSDSELIDGLPRIARAAPRMPDRISGGQFFGDAPALRLLASRFYAMAQRMADEHLFMGKDQNVYAALYAGDEGEKLILLLPPDGRGNPWWTFPRMVTSPTGHPACPLAPNASGFPRELTVCTLSLNEQRYLPEWLVFHSLQGVTHFTIYDHGSQPAYTNAGFEDVLEIMDAVALFPSECGQRHFVEHAQLQCQLAAFNDCVTRNARLSKWVAIFDIDEFLFAPGLTLIDFINARGADAYHFKGVLFGHGGRVKPPANEPSLPVPLLTAHYTQRQPCDVPVELRHLFFDHKEIFNPRLLARASVHNHEYVAGVVPVHVETCASTPEVLFFHYQYRSAEEALLKSVANNNSFLILTEEMSALYNAVSEERGTVYEPLLLSRLSPRLLPMPQNESEFVEEDLSFRQCWALGQSNYDMPGWDGLLKRLDVSPAPAVVVEVGGSIGEDASEYVRRYSPFLVVFEPQDTSFSVLESKFSGNPKALLLPYGIGAQNATLSLCGDEGSASAFGSCSSPATFVIRDTKSSFAFIERWLQSAGSAPLADSDALISINCEGCEYELLETLIELDLLRLFRTVQFSRHGQNYFNIYVPDSVPRYCRAQEIMQRTHSIEWVHPWMWERWTRRMNASPSVAGTTTPPRFDPVKGASLVSPRAPDASMSPSALDTAA